MEEYIHCSLLVMECEGFLLNTKTSHRRQQSYPLYGGTKSQFYCITTVPYVIVKHEDHNVSYLCLIYCSTSY